MGLRWAISLQKTELLSQFELLYRKALLCLPNEVFTKQSRFHYRNDSLASVIGQLLIRNSIIDQTKCKWEDVEVVTGEHGKPMLPISFNSTVDFNISHQGDLVVLATCSKSLVGVDVMRIDEDRNSSSLEHIEKMSKLFTDIELETIKKPETELDRWRAFYRIWCLKESVLKATGTGIVNDLRSFSFEVNPDESYGPGCDILSTKFCEKNIPQHHWLFEESFIGLDHSVAVGRLFKDSEALSKSRKNVEKKFPVFTMKSLEDLLVNAVNINDTDDDIIREEYTRYIQKPWKTF